MADISSISFQNTKCGLTYDLAYKNASMRTFQHMKCSYFNISFENGGQSGWNCTSNDGPFDPDNDHFLSLLSLFGGVLLSSLQNQPNPSKPSIISIYFNHSLDFIYCAYAMIIISLYINLNINSVTHYVNQEQKYLPLGYLILSWIISILFIISIMGTFFLQQHMGNDNHGREYEKKTEQEDDETNAEYTKIATAQRFCFRIIFFVSICIFLAGGFFQASYMGSSIQMNSLTTFLSGLIGNIILNRIFLTNTRTDRTSSLDYILSSQEAKERIIEMFTFEMHDYSHELILKEVNKHLPLNSRQN
ncbi:20058_t:CDS:2 [Gigaspora rosea]|nr:20058_t:CDS:2 [Gigaspora rosea]